jgi:O-methyltransferase
MERYVSRMPAELVPQRELYQPNYAPWLSPEFAACFARLAPYTLVPPEKCFTLASLAIQASRLDGEVWECGVYRGGTALLLSQLLASAGRNLRLFDTFEGMPEADSLKDYHQAGDFAETSVEAVRALVRGDFVHLHKGLIPDSFRGLEGTRISFAHVDVDIYSSIMACCEFIYPRLSLGGIMVFDDYGVLSCSGARQAVDSYFADKPVVPLVLQTGQAVVFKSFA